MEGPNWLPLSRLDSGECLESLSWFCTILLNLCHKNAALHISTLSCSGIQDLKHTKYPDEGGQEKRWDFVSNHTDSHLKNPILCLLKLLEGYCFLMKMVWLIKQRIIGIFFYHLIRQKERPPNVEESS